jgi:hypothetical protein
VANRVPIKRKSAKRRLERTTAKRKANVRAGRSPRFLENESRIPLNAWTPDDIKRMAETVWDQTTSGTNCALSGDHVPIPKEDCNCYIKNACRQFVTALPFDTPAFDADAIIGELARTGSGWNSVGTDPDAAAAAANAGNVVVAGLTSNELGENNGHVALVVIGTEYSGTWGRDLPRCVAGAINPVARVKDRGVQFSFPAKKAMEIRYFSRMPDREAPQFLLHLSPWQLL